MCLGCCDAINMNLFLQAWVDLAGQAIVCSPALLINCGVVVAIWKKPLCGHEYFQDSITVPECNATTALCPCPAFLPKSDATLLAALLLLLAASELAFCKLLVATAPKQGVTALCLAHVAIVLPSSIVSDLGLVPKAS